MMIERSASCPGSCHPSSPGDFLKSVINNISAQDASHPVKMLMEIVRIFRMPLYPAAMTLHTTLPVTPGFSQVVIVKIEMKGLP